MDVKIKDSKPFSPACERNREPIRQALADILLATDRHVLEVGSGTGQHAVYLASCFPHLVWHTSDRRENHAGIRAWIADSGVHNVCPPVTYEVAVDEFPTVDADMVFTANTLHIMPWPVVLRLIADLGENLKPGARVVIYGPFNRAGQYTAASNLAFDQWLKQQAAHQGIRDDRAVATAMAEAGFDWLDDRSMPANNRLLVFRHC